MTHSHHKIDGVQALNVERDNWAINARQTIDVHQGEMDSAVLHHQITLLNIFTAPRLSLQAPS